MLSKRVCKSCMDRRKFIVDWNSDSEKCWRNEKAIDAPCVTHDDYWSYIVREQLRQKQFPLWCQYRLEHMMDLQGDENETRKKNRRSWDQKIHEQEEAKEA